MTGDADASLKRPHNDGDGFMYELGAVEVTVALSTS